MSMSSEPESLEPRLGSPGQCPVSKSADRSVQLPSQSAARHGRSSPPKTRRRRRRLHSPHSMLTSPLTSDTQTVAASIFSRSFWRLSVGNWAKRRQLYDVVNCILAFLDPETGLQRLTKLLFLGVLALFRFSKYKDFFVFQPIAIKLRLLIGDDILDFRTVSYFKVIS